MNNVHTTYINHITDHSACRLPLLINRFKEFTFHSPVFAILYSIRAKFLLAFCNMVTWLKVPDFRVTRTVALKFYFGALGEILIALSI